MDGEHREGENYEEEEVFLILHEILNHAVLFLTMVELYFRNNLRITLGPAGEISRHAYNLIAQFPQRIEYLNNIVGFSDEECTIHLRMNRAAFGRLLSMVETVGGLTSSKYCSTSEQLVMFLMILAHHTKNRVVKSNFKRSGRTVSKYFHRVLTAIIRCHSSLLVHPNPISAECTDERWRWFQGCIGALDGTYIPVTVRRADMGRYRNRKGHVTVNVLGVCDFHMNFIYVLTGWEGSAADSRVLRDAMTRPTGLRVARDNYYLCDNGYTNGPGFLTPYRGVRYHLSEWEGSSSAPQNKEEYFNLKHSKARNVVERAFGLLKKRWAILRSPSFYPIRTQNRIIMACCLVHNFIRQTMPIDPLEDDAALYVTPDAEQDDYIDGVEPSNQWSAWRNTLAMDMYNEWRNA